MTAAEILEMLAHVVVNDGAMNGSPSWEWQAMRWSPEPQQ